MCVAISLVEMVFLHHVGGFPRVSGFVPGSGPSLTHISDSSWVRVSCARVVFDSTVQTGLLSGVCVAISLV